MAFSTFPNNPFPPSTTQFNEGKNDAIQAEIDAIKDGMNIDSFGDVENALATKTNLSNIAPTFDATSGVYAIGDKVIYDGVLYEFTSAHATAGEWDESEVQPVKISELVDSLKSGLNDLGSVITPTVGTNITLLNGGYTVIGNMVCVNLYISTAEAIPFNTLIATIVPPAISDTPISIYNHNTFDIVSNGRVYANGNIVASEPLDASAVYIIVGCYIKAS